MEGKYKLEKSENFDAFLDKLGVGFMVKTAAKTLKPTLEVEVSGDNYTLRSLVSFLYFCDIYFINDIVIISQSTFKNTEIKFKLGEKFTEARADGKEVEVSYLPFGNIVIQNMVNF